jgi:hypothetical protein
LQQTRKTEKKSWTGRKTVVIDESTVEEEGSIALNSSTGIDLIVRNCTEMGWSESRIQALMAPDGDSKHMNLTKMR